MRSGDQILGFAELKAPLSTSSDLHRWTAVDPRTAQGLVVVTPASLAKLRPGASERFDRAYRDRPGHPAVLPCQAHGVQEGRSMAVLPDHLPFPSCPLSPEEALQTLYWLIPGVIAAAPHLHAELRADDLVQLPSGAVLVSPSGIVRSESVSKIPVHLAPEILNAQPADSAAACLYGLGALVFQAVTSRPHIQARTMEQLLASHQQPTSIAPHLPPENPELAELLTAMLSPEPQTRLRAAANVPPIAQSPCLQREHPPTSIQSGSQAHVTQHLNRHSMTLKRWSTVLYPPGPNRSAIRRIAARTSLSSMSISQALSAQLPVPLGSFQDQADAIQLRQVLIEPDADIRIVDTGHGATLSWWLAGSLLGLAGTATALVVMGSSLPLAFAVGASAIVTAGSGYQIIRQSGRIKRTRLGMRHTQSQPSMDPTILAASNAISDARRVISHPDLPSVMALELNASLDALQDDLEDLFELRSEELRNQPVRDQVNRIESAARQIREAAQEVSNPGTHTQSVDIAIRRARAAKKTLQED